MAVVQEDINKLAIELGFSTKKIPEAVQRAIVSYLSGVGERPKNKEQAQTTRESRAASPWGSV